MVISGWAEQKKLLGSDLEHLASQLTHERPGAAAASQDYLGELTKQPPTAASGC